MGAKSNEGQQFAIVKRDCVAALMTLPEVPWKDILIPKEEPIVCERSADSETTGLAGLEFKLANIQPALQLECCRFNFMTPPVTSLLVRERFEMRSVSTPGSSNLSDASCQLWLLISDKH